MYQGAQYPIFLHVASTCLCTKVTIAEIVVNKINNKVLNVRFEICSRLERSYNIGSGGGGTLTRHMIILVDGESTVVGYIIPGSLEYVSVLKCENKGSIMVSVT